MLTGAVVGCRMAAGGPEDVHAILRGGAQGSLGAFDHIPELPVHQDLMTVHVHDLTKDAVVQDEIPLPHREGPDFVQIREFHHVFPPEVIQVLALGVEIQVHVGR